MTSVVMSGIAICIVIVVLNGVYSIAPLPMIARSSGRHRAQKEPSDLDRLFRCNDIR
jgi:hypothetical protein